MRLNGNGMANGALAQSDGNAYRGVDVLSNDDRAFIGGGSVGATASQYAHVQLVNPVGSGVTLLVDSIHTTSNGTMRVLLNGLDGVSGTFWGYIYSKKRGSGALSGEIRVQNNVAILGDQMAPYYNLANQPTYINFDAPFILGEGEGIAAVNTIVNSGLFASFQGRVV